MKTSKIIAIVLGSLLGAIFGSFICAAIGLWGLSYYVPKVFTFDWMHLLPLWCIMFAMQSVFRGIVDIKLNKD